MHYHFLIEDVVLDLVPSIFNPVIAILLVVGFYPVDKEGDLAVAYFVNFALELAKLLEIFYGFY